MNALRAWYEARDARERRVLLGGAVLVPIIVLIGGWFGLHSRLVAGEIRLESKRSDLAWLQAQAPQLAARPANNRARGNRRRGDSLVVQIDRVARTTGIAESLAGSQQAGSGAYRVQLDKVAFDAMVKFLSQLSAQEDVTIESASVDPTDASGLVNATLILRQP
jgi:general secretion pathway protein M